MGRGGGMERGTVKHNITQTHILISSIISNISVSTLFLYTVI